MTFITREQKFTIHILPDISRNKGNQTMKFGQLKQYNMRNIFGKYGTKCIEEASPKSFSKRSKMSVFLDQLYEILYSFFIVCRSQRLPKYIETKVPNDCFYLI